MTAEQPARRFRQGLALAMLLISAIWAVSILFFAFDPALAGLMPRSWRGLSGIIGMPFVHLNWTHLWANTAPLAVFATLLAWRGPVYLGTATGMIMLTSGVLLWCFGRPAIHIGASMLVFGYFGFLSARGLVEKRAGPLLASLAVILLYGGIVYGLLPTRSGISWDGHLAGLTGGIATAYILHRKSRFRR